MNDFTNVVLPYLIFIIIFFIIGVFITRWIFRIDKIVKLQEKQYAVFTLIAAKMGVNKEDLLRVENPQEYWNQQQRKKNAAAAEK